VIRRRNRSFSLSNSADYWPLTVVPSVSRSKRSAPWTFVAVLIVVAGALALAYANGMAGR
jgi:hypothetical protein